MADKEDKKAKAEKTPKADKAPPPDKAAKSERAAKAKADAAARAAGGAKRGEREPEPKGPARLRKQFDDVIRAALIEKFGYKNVMQVPMITKVVLNMGIGEGVADRKKAELAAADLALIAGQKAIVTYSRIAIATYKLRENQPIGAKVTLRKAKMYDFIDRLINIALPRVRDFRGLNPKSFDGRGNYTMGIKEHIIFPEIDYDKTESILGLDIVVCTTARNDEEARALLAAFNFPFRQ